jgi:putative ABC transport system permease protein
MWIWQKIANGWRRNYQENVVMALDTLRTNRLRSALTLMGITVAITTLIAVVALLMGLNRNIEQSIESYGVNTAYFSKLPEGPRFSELTKEERTRKPINYDDFLAVQEGCTICVNATVSIFSPGSFGSNQEEGAVPDWVRYKGEEVDGLDFRGVTADFFAVYANAAIAQGRPFTAAENEHRREVVVLGADVAKGLFGALDPIGKDVIADGQHLSVVGVFAKPNSGLGGPDNSDRRLVLPYWTFRKIFPNAREHGIRIAAPDAAHLPMAIDQARVALRRSRHVGYSQVDSFDYNTADSLIQNFHAIVGAVALAVTVIASVGLMIGGVGVMNIMLVSVTERTREIGVRMAIGARRHDITSQFLIEAMTLAATGGVIGVLLGYTISALVRTFVPSLPTFVPLWAVLAGIAVSTGVGLLFGTYPAVKAARMDPVVALRYE